MPTKIIQQVSLLTTRFTMFHNKNKFSVTAIICSVLLVLTNPLKAEDIIIRGDPIEVNDVFHCKVETGVFTDVFTKWKVELLGKINFKFQLKQDDKNNSEPYIHFVGDHYFDDVFMNAENYKIMIGKYGIEDSLKGIAVEGIFQFSTIDGRFTYVENSGVSVGMMVGTCDNSL